MSNLINRGHLGQARSMMEPYLHKSGVVVPVVHNQKVAPSIFFSVVCFS